MANKDEQFYTNLAVNRISLSKLLLKENLFKSVPSSWFVIITDIKNSTGAVLNGAHEDVNLIATGSIAAVLNIAFKEKIMIPFFFGGDGATFIVPATICDQVIHNLSIYKLNTLQNYNLDLRVGIMSIQELYSKGQVLKVSKFASAREFVIPIVLGNGLSYAEKFIKGDDNPLHQTEDKTEELDLSGMQCRWDKIEPPENSEEVISLIVVAQNEAMQAEVYSKVIAHLDEIYGTPEKRQPISVGKLIFRTSFNNLRREMTARLGQIDLIQLIKTWAINLYGYIYFRTESGKKYLLRLVEMSDTLVIDGKINTVITGTAAQRDQLQMVLNELELQEKIFYGIYVSKESVMSCYVRDLVDDHIHFVDGAEGGYTKAAGMLKGKSKYLTKN